MFYKSYTFIIIYLYHEEHYIVRKYNYNIGIISQLQLLTIFAALNVLKFL